jgi:hypothetical protein
MLSKIKNINQSFMKEKLNFGLHFGKGEGRGKRREGKIIFHADLKFYFGLIF